MQNVAGSAPSIQAYMVISIIQFMILKSISKLPQFQNQAPPL